MCVCLQRCTQLDYILAPRTFVCRRGSPLLNTRVRWGPAQFVSGEHESQKFADPRSFEVMRARGKHGLVTVYLRVPRKPSYSRDGPETRRGMIGGGELGSASEQGGPSAAEREERRGGRELPWILPAGRQQSRFCKMTDRRRGVSKAEFTTDGGTVRQW